MMVRRGFVRAAAQQLAVALFALAAGNSSVDAQSDSFWRGKTVTIVVGFDTGNGADSYARLLSRFISQYIPNHPDVIVQNMPGAGSLAAANYLFSVAPKDGTVFGIFNRNVPQEPLLGNARAKFDPKLFNWIGSTNAEPSVCVAWAQSPIMTWDDAFKTEYRVAATGINANTGLVPTVLNRVLHTRFKIIMGYPGAAQMSLAIERGEVEGRCGWSWSSLMTTKPDWVRDGKVRLIVQAGLQKSSIIPDVPLAMDSVKDERGRQLLKMAVAWDEMAWPFAAPPGVPSERVATLRDAFKATLNDPGFLDEAKKERLDIRFVSSDAIDAIVSDIYKTPPDIVAEMRDIVEPTK